MSEQQQDLTQSSPSRKSSTLRNVQTSACLLAGALIGTSAEAEEYQGPVQEPIPAVAQLDGHTVTTPVADQEVAIEEAKDGLSLPDLTPYIEYVKETTEEIVEGIEKLSAQALVYQTVQEQFGVPYAEVKELSPGVLEFTAEYEEGKEAQFIAVGADVYRVVEEPSKRDRRALKKVNSSLADVKEQKQKIYEELVSRGYEEDADMMSYLDHLYRIDTDRMPADVRKLFETGAALERTYASLQDRKNALNVSCSQRVLQDYNNKELGKTIMVTESSDYTFAHHDKKGEPLRVQRFDAEKGLEYEVDLKELARRLPENTSEIGKMINRCGQFAVPMLERAAKGEIPYTEKDHPRAGLIASYYLSKHDNPLALRQFLRITRGEVRVEDGWIRKYELPPRMLAFGPGHTAMMRPLLYDSSPAVQQFGAQYFAKHPDPLVAPRLVALLESDDTYVVRHAAIALGRLKHDKAVAPLIELLNDNVPTLSGMAAEALVRYPQKDALAAVKKAMVDPNLKEHALAGAVLSNDTSIVDSLVQYAGTKNPEDRVFDGLKRWISRDHQKALCGMVLAAYNPDSKEDNQHTAEGYLIELTPEKERWLISAAEELKLTLPYSAPEWQRTGLETFVASRKLGLEFMHRVPEKYRSEILKNRTTVTPDTRPLAIVVMARGDWNGAFYLSDTIFENLCSHDYRVLYYEAESQKDFVNALKEGSGLGTAQEQKAKILVFGGHGSQDSLHLERDDREQKKGRGIIEPDDEAFLKKAGIAAVLENGGQIVLDSCSNGKGAEEADGKEGRPLNMANFFRKIFPHAKEKGIWSAQESYGPIELKFNADEELIEVEYPVPSYQAFFERTRTFSDGYSTEELFA